MRTPGILIFGMVMAPCGWVLDLISTVSPNWRTINNLVNEPSDMVVEQGIWDICMVSTLFDTQTCNQSDSDPMYFNSQIIPVAEGMMVASLIVTVFGLTVATPGVRCWKDRPIWLLTTLGGLLIFCSGVLAIIPIAWYNYQFNSLNSTWIIQGQTNDIRVGYSLILGYIGGIMEVLGGFVMFLGICSCCGGQNRGETPRTNRERRDHRRPTERPTPLPRVTEPRNLSRNSGNSVPYSQRSLDDDQDFPRAKSHDRRPANTSQNGRPYDADL